MQFILSDYIYSYFMSNFIIFIYMYIYLLYLLLTVRNFLELMIPNMFSCFRFF